VAQEVDADDRSPDVLEQGDPARLHPLTLK
jgi:hypothetical protein